MFGMGGDAKGKGKGPPTVGSAIKMLVSPKESVTLIGKGGSTSKQIMEASGAKLHLSAKHELYPGTQMQEVSLKGNTVDIVANGVMQVLARLSAETGKILGGEWDVEEGGARIHFVVPTLAARACIGRGGESIKAIRAASGMKVHVEEISIGAGDLAEQVISLAGPLMGASQALPLILEKVQECAMFPWFTQWAYNVTAASPDAAMSFKGKGKGDFGGKGGGYADGMGGKGMDPTMATQSNVDMLSAAVSAMPQALANPMDRSQKMTFACPAEYVSSLIGKQGAGVKEISMATDTKIQIRDIDGNGAEKAVIIQGGAVGVVAAYLHVAARVASAKDAGARPGSQAYDPLAGMSGFGPQL
eukprot:TRINITY_DN9442_c0_g1_i1.p1 TRINITY_DN9442_c0_g1~~TRINITY_DN9442_c0_g1_i1.p1  ORF type:complete len:382 (+),score=98.58 TRINITY_DN9442_c0_g1_i1:71-1147(+)